MNQMTDYGVVKDKNTLLRYLMLIPIFYCFCWLVKRKPVTVQLNNKHKTLNNADMKQILNNKKLQVLKSMNLLNNKRNQVNKSQEDQDQR